jgi:hypothetical protein
MGARRDMKKLKSKKISKGPEEGRGLAILLRLRGELEYESILINSFCKSLGAFVEANQSVEAFESLTPMDARLERHANALMCMKSAVGEALYDLGYMEKAGVKN